jgi:hypothetical protein
VSNTPKFNYAGLFPVCPIPNPSPSNWDSYIDNLDISQVMPFFWSLESFTLTTVGTVTTVAPDPHPGTANYGFSFVLNPMSCSAVFDLAQIYSGGFFFGKDAAQGAFSGMPLGRIPRARVCGPTGPSISALDVFYAFLFNSSNFSCFANLAFAIGTDPVNGGKFRIYSTIKIDCRPASGGGLMLWQTIPPAGGYSSWISITNGTLVIGGITFPWYSSYRAGGGSPVATYTGGTLSATSLNYTYV